VLLELFDLSGTVDGEIKKVMWEMHHVRNVIVHRASCADDRIVEACPWMNLKRGQHIEIKRTMLPRYQKALFLYLARDAPSRGLQNHVDHHIRFRVHRSVVDMM